MNAPVVTGRRIQFRHSLHFSVEVVQSLLPHIHANLQELNARPHQFALVVAQLLLLALELTMVQHME